MDVKGSARGGGASAQKQNEGALKGPKPNSAVIVRKEPSTVDPVSNPERTNIELLTDYAFNKAFEDSGKSFGSTRLY